MCVRGGKKKPPRRSPVIPNPSHSKSVTNSQSPSANSVTKTAERIEEPGSATSTTPVNMSKENVENVEKKQDVKKIIDTLQKSNANADYEALKIMVVKKEKPKTNVERHIGDVDFSFSWNADTIKEKRVRKKIPKEYYDDTYSGPTCTNSTDNEFERPTERNYMSNLLDMEYVARDLMFEKNRKHPELVMHKKVDVYGPLTELENPTFYTWKGMLANTFWTNMMSLPSHAEVDRTPTATDTKATLQWRLPEMKLEDFSKISATLQSVETNERTCRLIDRTTVSTCMSGE